MKNMTIEQLSRYLQEVYHRLLVAGNTLVNQLEKVNKPYKQIEREVSSVSSVALQGAAIYSQASSFYTKGGQIRRTDKLINILAIIAAVGLSVAAYASASIALPLAVAASVLSVVMSVKNLAKWTFKNQATAQEMERLEEKVKDDTSEIARIEAILKQKVELSDEYRQLLGSDSFELNSDKKDAIILELTNKIKKRAVSAETDPNKQLVKDLQAAQVDRYYAKLEISGLSAVSTTRQYKIAQGTASVLFSSVALVGAVLTLTLGPIGLTVASVVGVVSLTFKVGLWLHQRYKQEDTLKAESQIIKKAMDYEPSYRRTLSQLTQGVVASTTLEPGQNAKTQQAIAAMPTHQVDLTNMDWTMLEVVDEKIVSQPKPIAIKLSDTSQEWTLVSKDQGQAEVVTFDEAKLISTQADLPIKFKEWTRQKQAEWNQIDSLSLKRVDKHLAFFDVVLPTTSEKEAEIRSLQSGWEMIDDKRDEQIEHNLQRMQAKYSAHLADLLTADSRVTAYPATAPAA